MKRGMDACGLWLRYAALCIRPPSGLRRRASRPGRRIAYGCLAFFTMYIEGSAGITHRSGWRLGPN